MPVVSAWIMVEATYYQAMMNLTSSGLQAKAPPTRWQGPHSEVSVSNNPSLSYRWPVQVSTPTLWEWEANWLITNSSNLSVTTHLSNSSSSKCMDMAWPLSSNSSCNNNNNNLVDSNNSHNLLSLINNNSSNNSQMGWTLVDSSNNLGTIMVAIKVASSSWSDSREQRQVERSLILNLHNTFTCLF